MRISHHFGQPRLIEGVPVGTYIKETIFEPGEVIPMHTHVMSHHSVLCSGMAIIEIDGEEHTVIGPKVIEIEAGKQHTVKAATRLCWLCVWATSDADEDTVDEQLVHAEA